MNRYIDIAYESTLDDAFAIIKNDAKDYRYAHKEQNLISRETAQKLEKLVFDIAFFGLSVDTDKTFIIDKTVTPCTPMTFCNIYIREIEYYILKNEFFIFEDKSYLVDVCKTVCERLRAARKSIASDDEF